MADKQILYLLYIIVAGVMLHCFISFALLYMTIKWHATLFDKIQHYFASLSQVSCYIVWQNVALFCITLPSVVLQCFTRFCTTLHYCLKCHVTVHYFSQLVHYFFHVVLLHYFIDHIYVHCVLAAMFTSSTSALTLFNCFSNSCVSRRFISSCDKCVASQGSCISIAGRPEASVTARNSALWN